MTWRIKVCKSQISTRNIIIFTVFKIFYSLVRIHTTIHCFSFSLFFYRFFPYSSGLGKKWLEKDRMYYMEILHGETYGSDWMLVFMKKPEEEDFIPLSNEYLYPYAGWSQKLMYINPYQIFFKRLVFQ